jgi:ribose transport system ATP-binding protein/inositol transport system ATP-binding protein
MKNVSKQFVGVYALNKMNLQVIKGEVHALMGENGAGKSTLMKILGGIYTADEGQLYIDGKETKINNIQILLFILAPYIIVVPRLIEPTTFVHIN